jgi:hypothetical protein
MSNRFDWDDDEDFRDIPDEVHERPAPPAMLPSSSKAAPMPEPQDSYGPTYDGYEDGYEGIEEDIEEDYSAVLSDARLRLEQGRLYEMIMNHDLFGNTDADAKAVNMVQKQIRKFAKEQMEVMLGMRQTVTAYGPSEQQGTSFNSLEVEALRAIAERLTQGASRRERSEAEQAPPAPRQTRLNPIGGGVKKQVDKSRPERRNRPLPEKPAVPVKRIKVDPNLEADLRSRGIEREYIEEAKRQLEQETGKPMNKKFEDMTDEELKERNRQIALRSRTQVRSPSALPMATPEQAEMLAVQAASSAPTTSGGLATIMDMLNRASRK